MKILNKLFVFTSFVIICMLLQMNISYAQTQTEKLLEQSEAKIKANKFKEAVKLLDKAIELSPQSAQLYVKRALSLRSLKKDKKALQDCKKAIELDDKSTDAYYQQGMVYAAMKDFQEAVASFRQALTIDKDYANAYLGMATVKQEAGDAEGACEDAKKAQELGSYEADDFVKKHCRR
ncbi:hypothetical protein BKI52_44990 [marine bacterium AO1-C]|nr:hypothetical protein BKI52_44990 [marine bacterium AO1-C]